MIRNTRQVRPVSISLKNKKLKKKTYVFSLFDDDDFSSFGLADSFRLSDRVVARLDLTAVSLSR